ncbi:nucleoside-diphosphate sugar epimerase/dehydratase [Aciduricibacillus chroicocephali]|uniref:Nucleoside-diphosphate sugar epimerase/dehydratase n=1 Tax=Aciduricibacillus chroicocephali TaxID=3054939 RepID=A0ABY9KV36_9BACI|nr:nucleoside-diphosphate sugar epimerase/dehydratase [Bacillaceae bacterium 44XB]
MSYPVRLAWLVILDSVIVSTAIFIATWLAYPWEPIIHTSTLLISAVALLVFHHIFAFVYHLYNRVWSYASVGEMSAIAKSVTWSIIATAIVQFLVNDFTLYKRALLVTWMIHILMIGGSRFIWRIIREKADSRVTSSKRALIIGAGAAGTLVVRQLRNQHFQALQPVGFIDDDPKKQRMQLYNIPVLGGTKDIERIVRKHNIDHIVIAIPSLGQQELNKLAALCHKTSAKTQMMPKIEDLMTGKISVNSFRNVEVEDLLGRDPVVLDMERIADHITGETILVTGAGGSIGSELCRQLMRFNPKQLVLLGHGEFSIYTIDMELRGQAAQLGITVTAVIGDVRDRDRIFEVVEQYKPAVIYHAAAHKHVPLMEYNPHEAVKNNIIGTRNVAEAADAFGVRSFVLVSTDKAVNPTNVMGATKRVAEMMIQDLDRHSKTIFSAVRFGNVLGSRGSVIPLFKKQIEAGGPVTVTDPEMTRYFMTIPEASRLVIQAGTLARGGEIFVLDMGEPVKIIDLARNLIELSGYTEEQIPIKCTGIRPGEKMYEELLNKEEIHPDAVFEKIYVGRTTEVNPKELETFIIDFANYDNIELKKHIMDIVYRRNKVQEENTSTII